MPPASMRGRPDTADQRAALRAAGQLRHLRTRAEKRRLAHELCRYLIAVLKRGHSQRR